MDPECEMTLARWYFSGEDECGKGGGEGARLRTASVVWWSVPSGIRPGKSGRAASNASTAWEEQMEGGEKGCAC